jgi:hypothetical protein
VHGDDDDDEDDKVVVVVVVGKTEEEVWMISCKLSCRNLAAMR